MKRRNFVAAATGGLWLGKEIQAQPAAWPTRPVRLVVPWAPGGTADLLARTVAQKLSDKWGQQVVIDNKPGGNTIVGASDVARAAPDGYTLFLPIASTMTSNQFLFSKLPYDPIKDFAPITMLAGVPLVFMGSESAPKKTLPELIELARTHPDTVTLGGAPAGTQLQTEQWMRDWGVKFRYVPYKSGVDITKALLGGEVDLAVDALANNLPHLKSGKIKGLAVNTSKRMPMIPDIPTLDDLKLKHAEPQVWHALVGPKGMAPALQSRINADVQAVLLLPDVSEKLREACLEVLSNMGPEELANRILVESAVVGPLVKELGLQVN